MDILLMMTLGLLTNWCEKGDFSADAATNADRKVLAVFGLKKQSKKLTTLVSRLQ